MEIFMKQKVKLAIILGAGSVIVIRILATIFHWNLPTVKNLDE